MGRRNRKRFLPEFFDSAVADPRNVRAGSGMGQWVNEGKTKKEIPGNPKVSGDFRLRGQDSNLRPSGYGCGDSIFSSSFQAFPALFARFFRPKPESLALYASLSFSGSGSESGLGAEKAKGRKRKRPQNLRCKKRKSQAIFIHFNLSGEPI